jgi:hypothetical protein
MTFKLNAARRLSAAPDVIAPAPSFREKNERQLDRQQVERERNDNRSSDNETAVRDAKPKSETAARTPARSADDLPQNDVQYASASGPTSKLLRLLSRKINAGLAGPEDDPLTHEMVNSKSTVDGDDEPGQADKFRTVNHEGNQLRANGPTTATEDPEDFNLAPVEILEDQPIDVPGDLALADADPKLWNMAQQPLGGIGG